MALRCQNRLPPEPTSGSIRLVPLGGIMITLCHAATGGSGTTVVACTRAIDSPGPSLLVDLEGDVPDVLGLAESGRPGVVDWLSSDAPIAHLDDLLVDVTPNCSLLPARSVPGADPVPVGDLTDRADRWDDLHDWLVAWAHDTGGCVVIDAGTTTLPVHFTERLPNRWLITRACYISLRRATRSKVKATGIVLIEEPGRGLSHRDVENSIHAPIVATIDWDIRVARSVDAGLLLGGRLPRSVHRALARVA